MYLHEPIDKYINDLAAKLPTPGGGSASGVSGALGTALLEMACNFTVGKEKYKSTESDILLILGSLGKIRMEFMSLIDEDVSAYNEISGAFKTKDKRTIDKALKNGYYISLKACRLSKDALEAALELPAKANSNLITDVGCGAELLKAAFNCGIFNAEINLKSIGDKDFVSREKTILEALKKDIAVLYKDILKGINHIKE